jgi:arylsulfatase A-like enzyme
VDPSHDQALDAAGRPAAHLDFLASHDAMVGAIANEPARWRRRHNYYLNCLRDVDRNIGTVLAELDIVPDMRKRGAVRSVYDGRYVFSRYFSPKQHNLPRTLESLYAANDVELFDRDEDPLEIRNLAASRVHRELVLAMNDKLNRLIESEVGEDGGQMLPGGIEAGWEVTPETMAPLAALSESSFA